MIPMTDFIRSSHKLQSRFADPQACAQRNLEMDAIRSSDGDGGGTPGAGGVNPPPRQGRFPVPREVVATASRDSWDAKGPGQQDSRRMDADVERTLPLEPPHDRQSCARRDRLRIHKSPQPWMLSNRDGRSVGWKYRRSGRRLRLGWSVCQLYDLKKLRHAVRIESVSATNEHGIGSRVLDRHLLDGNSAVAPGGCHDHLWQE